MLWQQVQERCLQHVLLLIGSEGAWKAYSVDFSHWARGCVEQHLPAAGVLMTSGAPSEAVAVDSAADAPLGALKRSPALLNELSHARMHMVQT